MREREADTNEIRMKIEDAQDNAVIFGSGDHNAEKIREAFGSDIVQRGDELIIRGGDTEKAKSAVLDFLWILDRQEDLDAQKTEYVLELNKEGQTYRKSNVKSDIICFTHRGRPIRAKTLGQIAYADNIRHNDIVFGIGPAGTGKTYLAVAMAVHAFKNKEVEKIILARPAVEAGESLGFLPGDLQEKVDPVSPSALRRAFRYSGQRFRAETQGKRSDRSRSSGIYERPDSGQLLYHTGRSAEHHAGTDENVSHPSGIRIKSRSDRRYHTDRSAEKKVFRSAGSGTDSAGCEGNLFLLSQAERCGSSPSGSEDYRRLRQIL